VDPETDVTGGAAAVASLTSREAHRRLAAAVVEELHVGAPEVPVGHAVEEVVEAGLGEGEPGQVDHDLRAHGLHLSCEVRGARYEDDNTRELKAGIQGKA
jgi:hypothetical protein